MLSNSKNAKRARKWRASNPERAKALVKSYRKKHPVAYKNRLKRWRKKNPDYDAAWRRDHRRECRDRSTRWRAENPEKARAVDHTPKAVLGRKIRRLAAYGLSVDDYERMLKRQKNKCAICRAPFEAKPYKNRPTVDHCHSSGKVRALLCHSCNIMLGAAKDSIAVLRQAVVFLQRHK